MQKFFVKSTRFDITLLLYVSASWQSVMRLWIRLHLHHQVARLFAQSIACTRIQIKKERGKRVDHE